MSPLSRFYLATFGCWPLVALTVLVASFNELAATIMFWVVFPLLIGSLGYAQFLARCPTCHWRIASFGKPFVRSLPPRFCPRCGTDLKAPV